MDDDGSIAYRRYQIPAQPAWVFIDRTGKRTTVLGEIEPDALKTRLLALANS
ncbi:MAG: hypothetical protein AB7L13_23705 [Acidimicrobiia bacterium]